MTRPVLESLEPLTVQKMTKLSGPKQQLEWSPMYPVGECCPQRAVPCAVDRRDPFHIADMLIQDGSCIATPSPGRPTWWPLFASPLLLDLGVA